MLCHHSAIYTLLDRQARDKGPKGQRIKGPKGQRAKGPTIVQTSGSELAVGTCKSQIEREAQSDVICPTKACTVRIQKGLYDYNALYVEMSQDPRSIP